MCREGSDNVIKLTEKDMELLSFLKDYKVMFGTDAKRIYKSKGYYHKRLKQLEKERYIKRVDWFKIKLDIQGTKLLRNIGYDYDYICRNQEYKTRIEEISKIAGITLDSEIRFCTKLEFKR